MTFHNFERRLARLIEQDRRPCPFCGRSLTLTGADWIDAEATEPDKPIRVYRCEAGQENT